MNGIGNESSARNSILPDAPPPNPLAGFNSRSALPNLAADTIFMDFVTFWMFLTDLRRIETVEIKYMNIYLLKFVM